MPYPGRPQLLDEVKEREVCALISAGCSVAHAARYVGCSTRTIQRHAERDEAFRQRLRRSEAAVNLTALETVRKAAATHWRAAAWLIKHAGAWQYEPDDYATQQRNKVDDMLDDMMNAPVTDEAKPPNGVDQLIARLTSPLDDATRAALRQD